MEEAPKVSRLMMEEQIAFVRTEKCKEPGRSKLLIAAKGWQMLPVVRASFTAMGGGVIWHRGIPPSGWMDEELACWLDALI